MRPTFTLTVATSADGFIARHEADAPASWVSAEEQALFFADVEAADWSVMGRRTHELADRPDRRRIVFSTAAGAGAWRRPTQLWLDPATVEPATLSDLVGHVRPMRSALILGGTRVHDWFLAHAAIDRVHLSIEPVEFGAGLPVFSDQTARRAPEAFADAGFRLVHERTINEAGTRFCVLEPKRREG